MHGALTVGPSRPSHDRPSRLRQIEDLAASPPGFGRRDPGQDLPEGQRLRRETGLHRGRAAHSAEAQALVWLVVLNETLSAIRRPSRAMELSLQHPGTSLGGGQRWKVGNERPALGRGLPHRPFSGPGKKRVDGPFLFGG